MFRRLSRRRGWWPRLRDAGLIWRTRILREVRAELGERGHQLNLLGDWSAQVGGGQGIMIDPETGSFMGGADPRRDGYAVGW